MLGLLVLLHGANRAVGADADSATGQLAPQAAESRAGRSAQGHTDGRAGESKFDDTQVY